MTEILTNLIGKCVKIHVNGLNYSLKVEIINIHNELLYCKSIDYDQDQILIVKISQINNLYVNIKDAAYLTKNK